MLGSWASIIAASFTSTALSEIGDRSFFVCTILSLKWPRWLVFAGTLTALTMQSLTSSIVGHLLSSVCSKPMAESFCAVLFIFFSILFIKDAINHWRHKDKVPTVLSCVAETGGHSIPHRVSVALERRHQHQLRTEPLLSTSSQEGDVWYQSDADLTAPTSTTEGGVSPICMKSREESISMVITAICAYHVIQSDRTP